MRVLWVLLALLVGVGAGVLAFALLAPQGALPVAPVVDAPSLGAAVPAGAASAAALAAPAFASSSAAAELVDAAAAGSAAPSASAPVPPTTDAAAASASAAPVAAPEDTNVCLRSFFSKDAFVTKSPNLRFVCEAPKPKEIASRLRVAIVDSAGGYVSDSMKEWSQLGFYELAVVATLRGHCCAGAKPLELPPAPEGCDSLGQSIEAISVASRPGGDDAALEQAVERFDGDIRCAIRLKRAASYGYSKVLPGEASVYAKIRARMKR
jgi:hypothetical protein